MDTAHTLRMRNGRPLGDSFGVPRRDDVLEHMVTRKYNDSSSIGRVTTRSERYGRRPVADPESLEAERVPGQEARRVQRSRHKDAKEAARRNAGPNRFLITLGLVVAIVAVCAFALYGPMRDYYVAQRSNAVLGAQLEQLTVANEQIQSHVDALQTREGIEDEARRRGYVEDGAEAVNVSGLPEGVDARESGSDLAFMKEQATETPWYQEFLDFIFQYTPPASS